MTQDIKRVQQEEGISDEELAEMVRSSAPVTHEQGNRRFHHWLFTVKNGQLIALQRWEMPERHLKGRQDLTVVDECEACEGDGCKECGWIGQIKSIYTNTKKK